MKLKFESWLDENNISEEAMINFKEGIKCYKIGAYRASFIMTYIGFQVSLKYKLKAYNRQRAKDNKDGLWDSIIRDISDEERWDNNLYDIVKRQPPNSIFLITDSIITQYKSLRCLRNECAHCKDSAIDNCHVEFFWLFIQSHYNKFIVNGGKAGLLDMLEKHYDTFYTPRNKDIGYIVNSISSAIKEDEIIEFFNEVVKKNISTSYFTFHPELIIKDFWDSIVIRDDNLKKKLLDFVQLDENRFLSFIISYPEQFVNFLESDTIRKYWTKWMWNDRFIIHKEFWYCFETLYNNKIIDEEEQDIFKKNLYDMFNNNNFIESNNFPDDNNITEIFKKLDLFSELAKFFDNIDTKYTKLLYLNSKWNKIEFYIKNIDIDITHAKKLNELFKRFVEFGEFYYGLLEIFKSNKKFREDFIKLLTKEKIEIDPRLIDLYTTLK